MVKLRIHNACQAFFLSMALNTFQKPAGFPVNGFPIKKFSKSQFNDEVFHNNTPAFDELPVDGTKTKDQPG